MCCRSYESLFCSLCALVGMTDSRPATGHHSRWVLLIPNMFWFSSLCTHLSWFFEMLSSTCLVQSTLVKRPLRCIWYRRYHLHQDHDRGVEPGVFLSVHVAMFQETKRGFHSHAGINSTAFPVTIFPQMVCWYSV